VSSRSPAPRSNVRPVGAVTAPPGRRSSGQLVRFVVAGLTSSASYAVVFLVMARVLAAGAIASNIAATLFSTVLANELHRRFSFRGAVAATMPRAQGAGAVMAALGLAASTLALAAWHRVAPEAGAASSLVVVYAVTAAVGLANFLAMRTVLGARPSHPSSSESPAVAAA
jgi:putative flippase GtrA